MTKREEQCKLCKRECSCRNCKNQPGKIKDKCNVHTMNLMSNDGQRVVCNYNPNTECPKFSTSPEEEPNKIAVVGMCKSFSISESESGNTEVSFQMEQTIILMENAPPLPIGKATVKLKREDLDFSLGWGPYPKDRFGTST